MEIGEIGEICLAAIARYGAESQERMMIEECSELVNALMKRHRGRATDDDVITEIADVFIMVLQMSFMYGSEKVKNEMERKLQRLRERMDKDNE